MAARRTSTPCAPSASASSRVKVQTPPTVSPVIRTRSTDAISGNSGVGIHRGGTEGTEITRRKVFRMLLRRFSVDSVSPRCQTCEHRSLGRLQLDQGFGPAL